MDFAFPNFFPYLIPIGLYPLAAYFFVSAASWFTGFDWFNDSGNRSCLGLIDANSWQKVCYIYQVNTCSNQHYYGDCYALGQLQGIQWQFICQSDCWKTQQYCIASPANSVSDGFIKGNSAIGFGLSNWNVERRINAKDINHNEETNNAKMEQYYRDVFTSNGYFKIIN